MSALAASGVVPLQRTARVVVTRPREQALPLVERLQAAGVDAVALPLLAIEPLADRSLLQAAWAALDEAAFVMFVSANAVAHFFAAQPSGVRWPAGARAGSTGPGTSAALHAAGVAPAAIDEPAAGEPFDTEALWRRIGTRDWHGRRVLVVRGEEGRGWLAEQFRAAGAQVRFVVAYRRLLPELGPDEQALARTAFCAPSATLWHFSSSQAITHLVAAVAVPAAARAAAHAVCTHERIAQAAVRAGFGRVRTIGVRAADVADAIDALASIELPPHEDTRG